MRCHYEILGIERNAGDDEIKKAYRKLALKWHPDKNINNEEEAKATFQLIQQAYETLGDLQERAFYDKHRETILKGGVDGDFKDNSLDVFQYFSASCYSGYGDESRSFYTVYREVFSKIKAEDMEYASSKDSDFTIPDFGYSHTDYEDVNEFYGYWQGYCTIKSYAWVDKYDIREAQNRWMVRQMEKENKKLRDVQKKKRNEEVRGLVSFVRKRDKRVQAHRKLLEDRAAENKKKVAAKQEQQLQQRRQLLEEVNTSGKTKYEGHMQGKIEEMEASYAAEFGDDDDDQYIDDEELDALYCITCDISFKSERALINHKKSKKHKEIFEALKEMLLNDNKIIEEAECADESEEEMEEKEAQEKEVEEKEVEEKEASTKSDEDQDTNSDLSLSESSEEEEIIVKKSKKKKKGKNKNQLIEEGSTSKSSKRQALNVEAALSKRVAAVHLSDSEEVKTSEDVKTECSENSEQIVTSENKECEDTTADAPHSPQVKLKGKKAKDARKKAKQENSPQPVLLETVGVDTELTCVSCKCNFPSKNKLFTHLKKTGHSLALPQSTELGDDEHRKKSKRKGKK